KANALQSRTRHDQGIRRTRLAAAWKTLLLLLIELAHARVGCAAKMDHLHFRKQPARVSRTPHGIGADLESLAARPPEFLERDTRPQHQNVACGLAAQRRADHEPRGVLVARHVLERMHGRVQLSRANGIADFGDEGAALAAMLQKLAGLIDVASGLELDDLDVNIGHSRGKLPSNLLGLHQRHGAFARADPQSNCQELLSELTCGKNRGYPQVCKIERAEAG